MDTYTWSDVESLRRALKRKEHKHAATGFVGMAKKILRNDMGYPQVTEEKDGSCVRGLYYAMKIAIILALLFVAGCFLFPKKGHTATASWYGVTGDTMDSWKHTTTANGEHFNENALTAASWKYPLGSLVEVINTRNHKHVIVRINDRGPGKHLYRKGRIIDLTRGSFARIASLRDGVIPIKVILIGDSR